MPRRPLPSLFAGLLALLPLAAAADYFRYPAIHGDTLVFTSEGDLWRASTRGGEARRLTTHAGQETHAALSADGTRVAFVAQYESPADVYVMPLSGGLPERLSFDGGRVEVLGWSPQGEVAYSSEDLTGPTLRKVIRLIDPSTRATRELPLHDANQVAFDAAGRVLVTRFGAHVNGDNVKAYRGGSRGQLWRFDPAKDTEAQRLAAGEDMSPHAPLWAGGRWFFVGNADGHDNLWSMDADGGDLVQHTRHGPWDVRAPRSDGRQIAYQLGADLRVFDAVTGEDRAIALQLGSDRDARRTRWLEKPLRYLESARLAPKGDLIALTVRGRVALASPGPRRRVEIDTPADSRAREAIVSHDGRWVYAISDAGGSQEIWRFAANGSDAAKPLTRDGQHHRWRLQLSPDGRWIAHSDKSPALHLLDLETGQSRTIDRSDWGGDDAYGQVSWAADGRALAFVRADSDSGRDQVFLHDLDSGRSVVLTSDRYESFAPAFSRDGGWLYFLSNRHFDPRPRAPWGDRNTGPGFDKRTRLYALALQPGLRFPFAPPDELAADTPADAPSDRPSRIELEGLAQRLFEAPLPPGNYSSLAADAERLYLLDQDSDGTTLKTYAIGNQGSKAEVLAKDVRSFELDSAAKRLAVVQAQGDGDPTLLIVDAGAKLPTDLGNATVRLADWRLPIDPPSEWKQMFNDAWRMHRDFSFDAGMRGVDWEALRARHAPLLARVGDRAELDDLLAQMIAHLGILHSQVRGADLPGDPESATPAALGAEFTQDAEGLRILHIYRSDPELPSERAPLAQPGVDARVGDLVESVNGRRVRHAGDLAQALQQQAGQQVLLGLRRGGRSHHTVAIPVDARRQAQLRYADWVQGRSDAVARASEGRIGYLHLRAMGPNDIASFVRDFYAHIQREGLIIDVRRNRGGNIDSWVIEKLLRRNWAFWQSPGRRPYWNMQQSFRGHLVVLVDALTYSDGETFAAGVKALGLGPVIGTRTAGAGIWLSDRNRLADGGIARIAEFGQFGSDGRWLVEGRGVDPDIEVDNLPRESYSGRDRQLEVAIEQLQQRLREAPVKQPPAQPIPPVGETGRDVSAMRG